MPSKIVPRLSDDEIHRQINRGILSMQRGIGHSSEQVHKWLDDWAEGKKRPIPAPDVFPEKK